MKRRSFFKTGIAAGTLLSVNSCQTQETPENNGEQVNDVFPLNEITISDLQKLYHKGELTCKKVIEMYLDRIDKIDKAGPALNSVIEINPDAMAIAKALDEERKSGKTTGPLHGIPIMLKDNIETAGKMMTTAGSLALQGNYASQNSWVAEKLEQAGAIILGKTNLSEWANFRSNRSSSGWSGRGGQTRNPYILDRNPCGSSSGSGVTVSANLCATAIGTETNGSVVCPASINGIVGIKPTVGLVSRAGIIPIAHSQDTAGPMARTVRDAAMVLGALTGIDGKDKYTQKSQGKSFTDYTTFLQTDSLINKRIGVAKHFFGFHEKVDLLMERAIKDLQDLGAKTIDMDQEDLNGKSGGDAYEVLLYEFKYNLNSYLKNCTSDIIIRSLEELIKFNKDHADTEMPFFGQEVLIAAQEKGDLNSDEYKNALDNVLKSNGPEGIDRVMDKYNVDAIIAPTGGPAWPTDVITGDHFLGGSSSPAARSGYPSITLPMGFIHGLPIGISFFSEAFSEAKLISFAYAYEQATKHRKAPKFIPTFDTHLNS